MNGKFFKPEKKVDGAQDPQMSEAEIARAKFKKMDAKTDTEKFKLKEVKIQKDIYSLGYAAIIHPMECEVFDAKLKYMPRITLLNEERTSLFISANLVTLVQGTTIMLIVIFFGDGKGVHLVPA